MTTCRQSFLAPLPLVLPSCFSLTMSFFFFFTKKIDFSSPYMRWNDKIGKRSSGEMGLDFNFTLFLFFFHSFFPFSLLLRPLKIDNIHK